MRIRRPAAAAAAVGWMALIFALSSLPGSAVPSRFGPLGHFVLYAVLGALYRAALDPSFERATAATAAVVLASVYGVTDEVHQLFVSGRTADPLDWAIDTLGALSGVLLTRFLVTRALSRSRSGPPARP